MSPYKVVSLIRRRRADRFGGTVPTPENATREAHHGEAATRDAGPRGVGNEILPTVRELGIGFVAYSPLGRGFLSGRIRSLDDFEDEDFRRRGPRFQEENLAPNLMLVERLEEIAAEKGVEASQLALAWVLDRGDDVVPIPGTKRRSYLEQNAAAAQIELTDDERENLDAAFPVGAAARDRYPDMSTVNR